MFSKILMIVLLGILAYLVFITMTEPDNFENNKGFNLKNVKNSIGKMISKSNNKPKNKTIDIVTSTLDNNSMMSEPKYNTINKVESTLDKKFIGQDKNELNNKFIGQDKNELNNMMMKGSSKTIDKVSSELNNMMMNKTVDKVSSALNNNMMMNKPMNKIASALNNNMMNKPKNKLSNMFKKQENMINTEGNININYEHFEDISGITDNLYGAAPFGDSAQVNQGDMATVNYTGLVDAQPGDVIQIEGTDLLTAPLIDNMLYTNSIANTNRNASQDLRGDIPLQFNDNYTPFYSSVIYGAPLSQKTMTINNL